MSLRRIAILISCVAALTSAAASAQDAAGRLRWKNGDELTGRLVGATPTEVVWRADALSQEVELDLSVLDKVFLERSKAPADKEDSGESEAGGLRVLLAGGLVVSGQLKTITDEQVVIGTERHGEMTLRRSWIESLQRSAAQGGVIDLVGSRGEGWRSVDPRFVNKRPSLADWDFSDPERVVTTMPGGRLYLRSKLPDFCDVELSVQSTGRPAFSLALGSIRHLQSRTGNLEIETWGDRLVVTSPASEKQFAFESLESLEPARRTVTLRVFWNRRTGKVSVFGPQAELLAEAKMALAPDITTGGVLIENKGADLTVTRLSVNAWSADQNPQIVTGQDRLRTTDGHEYYGTISGPDDDGQLVVRSREGAVTQIAPNDVAQIILHRSPVEPSPPDNCELLFADDTLLRGRLQKIAEGVVTLQSGFAATPIASPLDEVQEFRFITPAPADAPPFDYVLESAGKTLRGTLAAADAKLGWRLVGAKTVIPLDLNHPVTIRRLQKGANSPGRMPSHTHEFVIDRQRTKTPGDDRDVGDNLDTLVLTSGEQLPCKVESIDDAFVVISSNFSAAVRIPTADVRAVTLGTEGLKEVVGFDAAEWQIGGKVPDQIERHPDRMVFHDQASFSHPTLLSGGTLEFDVDWDDSVQTYLMMNLFPAQNQNAGGRWIGRGLGGRQQRMFYLYFFNRQVMVHVLEGNGFRQMNAQQQHQLKSPIHCRIQVRDDEIVLSINDKELGKMSVGVEESAVMGVSFQTQQVRNRNGQRGGDVGMTISNLRAGRGSGLFHQLGISKAAREYVVTIPRMRRDRPPSHILVGRNGDLLRGKLLALGPTSALFQSRLDDVTIPRDRLAGIIWPPQPVDPPTKDDAAENANEAETKALPKDEQPMPPKDAPPAESAGTVRATFTNGVVMELVLERMEGDALVARHPIFGECHLSLTALDKLQIGNPAADDSDGVPTFTEWTLIHAREPVIPDSSGEFGTASQLIGQPAEDFSIPLLEGGDFRLREQRGKIVVLDFWATWCGPCIQAMPQLMAATSAFPDDVVFVGVNQDETPEVINKFLDSREWKVAVGLDRRGVVGQKYEVQGIPQTVVIGRDGTIEHVHLGASADLESALTKVLEGLVKGEPVTEP